MRHKVLEARQHANFDELRGRIAAVAGHHLVDDLGVERCRDALDLEQHRDGHDNDNNR